MAQHLQLSTPVIERPVDQWESNSVELLGAQTRFVQGERWRHRVIEAGRPGDEPLVLIHGVGGHAESYARNVNSLARQGFHVIAVDALYHGLTDKEPYDDDERYLYQVAALIDLLDALGIESANVEGESMGATIAFHFGMDHPDRARKIILNTGFGHVKLKKDDFASQGSDLSELAALSREVVLNPSTEAMWKRLTWLVADEASMTLEMVRLRMALYAIPEVNESMRKVFRIDKQWSWELPYTEEDCAAYRPETLVLWTDQNPVEGPDYGEYIAGLLPRGQFYCIEGAGHWPQWEKPTEHDAVLTQFILGKDYVPDPATGDGHA